MSEEEHIKLKYGIDLRGSAISDEEVIPFVKHTIEESKKKYSEKAKAFDKIEIVDTELREYHIKLSADVASTCTGIIIIVILRPIIVNTWNEIVIPLLKKKLKIEQYKDD